MNPYFITLSFLLMMSLITASETKRFFQGRIETISLESKYKLEVAKEEIREFSRLEELRELQNPDAPKRERLESALKHAKPYVKKARSLGVNAARPPNNSRLNFYLLLHAPEAKLPKAFSYYEIAARLMRSLYQHEPFFQQLPDAERKLLDLLVEKKEQTSHFKEPEQLMTINLENEQLQSIFYFMLKGTKTAPSLLNYITFDPIEGTHTQKRKINLLFADSKLLEAIFGHPELAQHLVDKREALWEQIAYHEQHYKDLTEKEKRSDYKVKLKKLLQETLELYGIKPKKYESYLFDCTLGKSGSVLFLEDPLTHQLIRQKYISRKRLSHPG